MRKIKKIALVLVLFISIFTVTGCRERKEITPLEFQSTMIEKGYQVSDLTSQFANATFLKAVYVATKETYQVEYFEFENEERAKEAFQQNKSDFEDARGSITKSEITADMGTYQKYQLVSNGKFMTVSRIGKTMIFANEPETYKDAIKKDIDDLGY